MAAAAVVEAAPFKIPDKVPPGNWLARQIRLLNEDSGIVFPKSAGSQRPYDKYGTVYKIDYRVPTDFDPSENEPELQPKPKIKQTVADALLTPRLNQMFVNWKVPDKYVPTDEPQKELEGQTGEFNDALVQQTEKWAIEDSQEPKKGSAPPRAPAKSYTPGGLRRQKTYAGKVSPPCSEKHRASMSGSANKQVVADKTRQSTSGSANRQEAPMLIRQMSLPVISSRSQQGSAQNVAHRTFPTVANEPRSMTQYPIQTGSAGNQSESGDVAGEELSREELEHSLQPHAIAKAEEWFKKASKSDRKIVEQLLRMTDKKGKKDNLNKSLLPDCKQTVAKWLDTANEKERQVALKFFNSLTGSRLMGMTAAEQRMRLQQVIDTLENGFGKEEMSQQALQRQSDRELLKRNKHLRLLTPNTRRNRWMYTTWHHLPSHKNKANAENFRSHFFRPLEPIPRHFVIHPDWG
ncbi:hypothetical protein ScPMuIL_011013 [Solemya velum]